MKKEKKYLTIEEKRQLVLERKNVPVCAYSDEKAEKRRKIEKRKLFNCFFKYLDS